jgi:hypothetical protein
MGFCCVKDPLPRFSFKRKPMKYPFLFIKDNYSGTERFYKVIIASHVSLIDYDSRWMGDSDLGDYCLVPDVDISQEEYIFKTEEEALDFIKEWWKKQ